MVADDLLLSKGGKTMRDLACSLIALPVGHTVPTITQLREELATGSGTIQKSFRDLEAVGAVQISARGHLGSVLVAKDIPRLWEIAGLPALIAAMPLPHSAEFETLATALVSEFEQLKVPFDLAFMHGAQVRLDALSSGKLDAVVSSLFAARRFQEHLPTLRWVDLPVQYYDPDSLVILSRIGVDPANPLARVGIDRRSLDHAFLTERYFAGRLLCNCAYTNLPSMIAAGTIDMAIWHRTFAHPFVADLTIHVPEDQLSPQEHAEVYTAVLLYNVRSPASAAIAALNIEDMAAIAAGVRAHDVPVRY